VHLFFLHIPKTAGTSVANVLSSLFGSKNCSLYIEGLKHEDRKLLRDKNIISGHLFFEEIHRLNYISKFKLATVFRDPYARLASHIQYMDRYSTLKFIKEYYALPKYLRNVVDRISRVNFRDPRSLEKFFSNPLPWEKLAFDNSQVRFLVDDPGPNLTAHTLDQSIVDTAIKKLSRFDHLGITENISSFISDIAASNGMNMNYLMSHSNKSEYGGRKIDYRNPDIRSALHEFVKYDVQLYEAALIRIAPPLAQQNSAREVAEFV
jgi:hypothetical protein